MGRAFLALAVIVTNTLLPELILAQLAETDFNAGYKVDRDYSEKLNRTAFKATGNSQFKKPEEREGYRTTWDPKPSEALKALGLKFEEGNLVMYVASRGMFYAKGPPFWLRSLEAIHREHGIFFQLKQVRSADPAKQKP